MNVVLSDLQSGCLTLTLNRPDRLNAVSEEMYRELIGALQAADSDRTVRAVVLTGAGRAFCVGADLKAHGVNERSASARATYVELGQRACEQIQTMTTPVVAAVNGYALGAGAEIAVSADFLIMDAEAQMGFPEISIGTFVGGGVTHRLPRLIGLRKSIEILMSGDRFSSQQAADWGLANTAAPSGTTVQTAQAFAHRLTQKAPLSMARLKAALQRNDSFEAAMTNEAEDLLAIMDTRDWAEGVAAFAARRTPEFRGE